jgi:uncharacterized protein involved in outer membrane biogenesis
MVNNNNDARGVSMKAIKILAVLALLFVVVIGGAIYYVASNLDGIVKAAIEQGGSEATKTAVTVNSVTLDLTGGKGAISGLTVASPKGFTEKNIFTLGQVAVALNIESTRGDVITIDRVTIDEPVVVYELNDQGVSNVDTLKKNLPKDHKNHPQEPSEQRGDVKIILRSFVLDKGTMIVIPPKGSGEDKQTTILPRIEITDIGAKEGGVAPDQVAAIVMNKIMEKAQDAAMKMAMEKAKEEVKKQAEDAIDRELEKHGASDEADQVNEGLGSLFGN